jgi:hypothetical protein
VTIALLAGSCLLLFTLLSKRAPVVTAAAASILPALHPAASEIVADLCCQPIATAGLFSVASAAAWSRMRERPSAGALGLVVLLCSLAVTSYEAAVALPVFLLLADLWLGAPDGSKARRGWPRLAMLGVVAAYVPWAIAIRHGLVAPDTKAVRPLGEVLLALRFDSVAYVCKALGLFDPTAPTTYWLQHRVGEPLIAAITVGLLAAVVWLVRGSRLGITGVVGFALFLAPPLLTRATVSGLNFPTLRQLYLPVLMGAPPLMVALARARLRLRVAIPVVAWAAALAVESQIAGGTLDMNRDRRLVTESTERILAGVPGDRTVVAVGTYLCGFAPSLIWAGPSLLGIPSRSDDPDPQLTTVDERTLIARSDDGFDVRTEADVPTREPGANRGPDWIPSQPAELAERGSQRIAGATVTIEAREGQRITALRYRFDRPLSEMVFVRFRGCAEPVRMALEPAR